MVSSLQRRGIKASFQLAAGTFRREGDPDVVELEGFRCRVEIDAPGGYEFSTLRLYIYGVDQETMNRLTVINYQNLDFLRNTVRIEATDDAGEYATIFLGEIYVAQPDYTGAPDVPFIVEARAGLIGSLSSSAVRSYPGAQSVAVIMDELAKELNLTLENNGVDTVVTDQYLAGSPLYKVQKLADIARIQFWYVPEQGVLAIAPQGSARRGEALTYSDATGLIGWPTKTHVGVSFASTFNPAVFHGCRINMMSSVPSCNGEWYIVSMSHRLDSELPDGAWFTHSIATPERVTVLTR